MSRARLHPERFPIHVPAPPGNGGAAAYMLEEMERQHIIAVLKKTRGVIEGPNGAARCST